MRRKFSELATGIYKVRNHLGPPIAKDLFVKNRNRYDLKLDS